MTIVKTTSFPGIDNRRGYRNPMTMIVLVKTEIWQTKKIRSTDIELNSLKNNTYNRFRNFLT